MIRSHILCSSFHVRLEDHDRSSATLSFRTVFFRSSMYACFTSSILRTVPFMFRIALLKDLLDLALTDIDAAAVHQALADLSHALLHAKLIGKAAVLVGFSIFQEQRVHGAVADVRHNHRAVKLFRMLIHDRDNGGIALREDIASLEMDMIIHIVEAEADMLMIV